MKKRMLIAMMLVLTMVFSGCSDAGGDDAAAETAAETKATTAAEATEGEASGIAAPEGYPDKVIEWLVPVPGGAALDIYARALDQAVDFGGNTAIVNKGGAAMTIGMTELYMREADGYTIGVMANPGLVSQPLLKDLPYKLEDFRILFAAYDMQDYVMMARPDDDRFQSFEDVLTYIEAGNSITITTANTMSLPHMMFTYFFDALGAKNGVDYLSSIEHIASTSGTAGAQTDFLGGHVDIFIVDEGTVKILADQGQANAIFTFSDTEARLFPDAPTAGEDYEIMGCDNYNGRIIYGMKAGTPDDIFNYVKAKIEEGSKTQEYQDYLAKMNVRLEDYKTEEEWMETYKAMREANEMLINKYFK